MSMKILMSSEESKRKIRRQKRETACPNCSRNNIGTYKVETKGFFKIKVRTITKFTCFDCKYVYEVTGEWRD